MNCQYVLEPKLFEELDLTFAEVVLGARKVLAKENANCILGWKRKVDLMSFMAGDIAEEGRCIADRRKSRYGMYRKVNWKQVGSWKCIVIEVFYEEDVSLKMNWIKIVFGNGISRV